MTMPAIVPQSAALPYVVDGNGLLVLLITSRGRGRWVLPKGNLAPGMSAARSAAKEADEEAGIAGPIADTAIGTYTYRKRSDARNRAFIVDVFPMLIENVARDWLEAHQRRREWFPCDVAATLVEEPDLRAMLGRFGAVMGAMKFGGALPHGPANVYPSAYSMETTSISSMPVGVRNFTTSPS